MPWDNCCAHPYAAHVKRRNPGFRDDDVVATVCLNCAKDCTKAGTCVGCHHEYKHVLIAEGSAPVVTHQTAPGTAWAPLDVQQMVRNVNAEMQRRATGARGTAWAPIVEDGSATDGQ